MKKRIISMLLVIVLLLSVLPVAQAVQMTEDGEFIFEDSRGNEVIVPPDAFATRVVDTYTGKKWTTHADCKDPDNILGPPYDENGKSSGCYVLGNYGWIILEFSVDIVDNEGMDIYVFEIGNEVEPTKVEVSVDGREWLYVGDADGALSGVDLAGKVPEGARYHYVRLTDLGKDDNRDWPGADISAVAGLNVKNVPFRDIPLDAYYYGPVAWAYDNGITNGVDATHFGPTANCTRAQVVTFLYRTYK